MSADRIHLVRHGEVDNPANVVYADLPGFGLSELGRRQAAATAAHLAARPVELVASSPLQRARETAEIVAAAGGWSIVTDERLTEWTLARRWAGIIWEDLPRLRPGEVEAYLDDPADLPFAPESLDELAARMAGAIEEWAERVSGELVVVSHQDPLHAAVRRLTGRSLMAFNEGKPGHAAVVTVRRADGQWVEEAHWAPGQGPSFPPPLPEPAGRARHEAPPGGESHRRGRGGPS